MHRWVAASAKEPIAGSALTIPLVQVLGTTLTTQPSAGGLGAAGLHHLRGTIEQFALSITQTGISVPLLPPMSKMLHEELKLACCWRTGRGNSLMVDGRQGWPAALRIVQHNTLMRQCSN
jgi:hypothetical protein